MHDYSAPTTTHKTPHPKIGFVYIIPLGLFLGFVIFSAMFFYRQKGNKLPVLGEMSMAKPTPTAVIAEVSISPTAKPTTIIEQQPVDKKSLSIIVLNGSGVGGAAGKVAAALKAEGYTKVKTGNADAYDFKDLTIRYVSSAKNAVTLMTEDLKDSYTVAETEEASLSGSLDIEIVVGKTASMENE